MASVNWKRVHDVSLPPEHRESNWRFVVGALTTKDLLFKINRIRHNKCTWCNSEETYKHIVLNCPCANFQWVWVGRIFKCFLTEDNILFHKNFKSHNTYLFNCVISIVKRVLWKARCETVYDKKRITPGLVKLRILDDIKWKIMADRNCFSGLQFTKFYSGTRGTVWDIKDDVVLLNC